MDGKRHSQYRSHEMPNNEEGRNPTILANSRYALCICGLWRPSACSTGPLKYLFDFYSGLVILIITLLNALQVTGIAVNLNDINYFAHASFIAGIVSNACWKAFIVLLNRRKFIRVMKLLTHSSYMIADSEEKEIRDRFDRFTNTIFWTFTRLVVSAAFGANIKPFFSFEERELQTLAWYPFDNTKPFSRYMLFWTFYMICTGFFAAIEIGTDTLITGLMTQVCVELEILLCRIRRNVRTKDGELGRCVEHHVYVYHCARSINDAASPILFVQFFTSIFIICVAIYHITMTDIDGSEILVTAIFFTALLTETLLYCWLANQVILKSKNTVHEIFHIDWTDLRVSDQKILLLIMKRAGKPIIFTASFLVTMSLESFVGILKTSYSIFNLLKTSTEKTR